MFHAIILVEFDLSEEVPLAVVANEFRIQQRLFRIRDRNDGAIVRVSAGDPSDGREARKAPAPVYPAELAYPKPGAEGTVMVKP